jgi:endonuclease-8
VAEGDTIHRLARRFRIIEGREVIEAAAPSPQSPLRLQGERLESLRGRRLRAAEARGKHLLLHFDDGVALHSHLGMRGTWRFGPPGAPPPRRGAPWAVLATDGAVACQFGGPHLRLLSAAELRSEPRLRALGPDLLAPGFAAADGVAALRRADPRTELGEALLDQGLIAGIGNIYKSESCFAARVSPWRRLADAEDAELTEVVEAAVRIMGAAVEASRSRHAIYRRAGQPCPRCRTPIRSRGQGDANRTTYWCPSCQAR